MSDQTTRDVSEEIPIVSKPFGFVNVGTSKVHGSPEVNKP